MSDKYLMTIGLLSRLLNDPDDRFRRRFLENKLSINAISNALSDRAKADGIEDYIETSAVTGYLGKGEEKCRHGR